MKDGSRAGLRPLTSLSMRSPICATMTPAMMPTTAGFSLSSVVAHLSCKCVWGGQQGAPAAVRYRWRQ